MSTLLLVAAVSVAVIGQSPSLPVLAPAPQPESTTRSKPPLWRIANVQVPSPEGLRTEVHILREDGTPVLVGEGLADVGQSQRLRERATVRPSLLKPMLGGALVLGGALALGLMGALATAGGVALWGVSMAGSVASRDDRMYLYLPSQGPIFMVGGLIAMFTAALVAGSTMVLGLASLLFVPRKADPALLVTLSASPAWDPVEADEVVRLHNAAVLETSATPQPAQQSH